MENSINTENVSTKGLNKKTKAQLIDIILRKDDIERDLRKMNKNIEADCIGTTNTLNRFKDDFEKLKEQYDVVSSKYGELKLRYNELFEEYTNAFDEYATIDANNKEYYKKVNRAYKIVLLGFAITCAVLIISAIV